MHNILLLSSSNDALTSAATASNKHVKLGNVRKPRPASHPDIEDAQSTSLLAAHHLKSLYANHSSTQDSITSAKASLSSAKASLQRIAKLTQYSACYSRYTRLHSILCQNQQDVFKSIKKLKSVTTSKIQKLAIIETVYSGSSILDGFYDSLSSLKAPDMSSIHSSPFLSVNPF